MNYVDFKNKCCNIMCLICLFFLLYVEVPDVQFSKIFFLIQETQLKQMQTVFQVFISTES